MALWDKSREECEQIINQYMDNAEKMFGRRPSKEGIAEILGMLLDEKLMEFTRQTFNDLTPQTLIHCGKILTEEPLVQIVPSGAMPSAEQQVEKSKLAKRGKKG